MSGCRIVVIAHGKSEVMLFKRISQLLKVRVEIVSNDGGNGAIKIPDAVKILEDPPFTDERKLHQKYPSLEYEPRKGDKLPGVRIFPVMDLADNPREARSYCSKDIFRGSCMYGRIVPIYNDGDLDSVMEGMGYRHIRSKKVITFQQILDDLDFDDFLEKVRGCPNTNMEQLLEYCLKFSS